MDLFDKLLKSFEGEDELGVVIRAHIVIEQYLNTLLESLVADPKYLKAMNLDYSQTVQMALTLGLDPRFAPALSSLGKIRNEFAHSLVPNISKQAVNNLYSALDENTKFILNNGISKVSSEIGQNIKHKTSSNKQQFVYITAVLAAALHKACKEAGIAT
ncbi:hypothetical protein Q4602_22000 [Paraglaciecola chathamensis]|uniref:hypothetical protein n=1 Tax=Paraglaciecola chathamensis TaxID=368405 RepID=UPI0026F9E3D4|nr:hypothetical protein [Paraglaciecola chathamensis]MDO6842154.1 hypothetical protein [Paraglaciecola chathamensis]